MDDDPGARVPGTPLYGFPPVYYPGAADLAGAKTIDVSAGQTVEVDLSLTAQPYYDVKIPVVNGEANAGMNVSVQAHRGPGYSLGYNPGEQRIEGQLPNGNYVVEAAIFGINTTSGKVNLKVDGGPANGPPLMLLSGGSITLNVKEEFTNSTWSVSGTWGDGRHNFALHAPRLYLRASAESADDFGQPKGGSIRPPKSANDESMVLENLLPGRYWLRLNTARGYIASATAAGTDVLREPLVVGSGNVSVDVKLRDDVAEVEGAVTNIAAHSTSVGEASAAVQGWVYFVPLPDSSGQFQQTSVSPDGKFGHSMMAPGSYRVLAFANQKPNLPYRDTEAMKAYESKGQVVTLTAGQKSNLQVPLIQSSE